MSVNRLVVVSNRLPDLKSGDKWREGKIQSAGGLVSALLPVMENSSRGLWLGWSGRTSALGKPDRVKMLDYPMVKLCGMDLTDEEVNKYYNGFCNRTLWPLFHCFQGRVKVDAGEQDFYFRVNRQFASALSGVLDAGDTVWIHDYHMVPLGGFLREAGFEGPLGFFCHIPFPPIEMIEILSDPIGFMDAWLSYDLVGFHSDRYTENYFEVMERLMLGVREGDRLISGTRRQTVLTCPIGINPAIYNPAIESGGRSSRRRGIHVQLPECKIALSVDRLDYTKGIPERMASLEHFFKSKPEWRRKLTLVQVCAPSRTRVKEYREQKEMVDAMSGRINGEYGEHDWEPIRYLYRSYGQADLARFYRDADIGLVTPLRDGMNLVAMEYVAAQRPETPGVLVLSRFTGVAEHLSEAVLVNPYLPESVAEGLEKALTMPLIQRKERYQAMINFITRNTAEKWAGDFIARLNSSHSENFPDKKAAPRPAPAKKKEMTENNP